MDRAAIKRATSQALIKMRKDAGMTQVEASSKAGIPQSNISRWETGTVTPDVTNLYALAQTYDVELSKYMPSRKTIEQASRVMRPEEKEG